MADDQGARLFSLLPAVFTAGAGAVHLAAAVPHLADSVLLGSGFVAVGWAQLAAAALLLSRHQDRTVRWSVVALNAVAVAAWALSRTVGLPVGHPGPETIGLADALTVALEVLTVGALVWRSRGTPGRGPTGWRRAVVLASAWTLVVGGSTLAMADVGTHGHVVVAETAHDDIAPRSWPGTGLVGSSNDPDPDHADTDPDAEEGTAHTHAPDAGTDLRASISCRRRGPARCV